MQKLCGRRALHILEYELETLMLHRMPRLMVAGEALMSKLMPLLLMNFQVNADILHA